MFKPTWLYIKQHNKTGLKYFGKTIQDPHKYKGSGKYWKRHLTVHGNDVTTVWTQLFESESELTAFAFDFSIKSNIVESSDWANLKPEFGTDGGNVKGVNKGVVRSEEMKAHLSELNTGKKQSAESSSKKSKALKGKVFSESHLANLKKPKSPRSKDHSAKISAAKKGQPWSEVRRAAHLAKNSSV